MVLRGTTLIIPSQAQLSSQLGLVYVHFPQLEFRAVKPVVTTVPSMSSRSRHSIEDIERTGDSDFFFVPRSRQVNKFTFYLFVSLFGIP